MALLSISAAARVAGKDRGTIKRYIKNGLLASVKDAAGKPKIDTSELLRVFGELVSTGEPDNAGGITHENATNTTLQNSLETLREQLRAAQGREEWLKKQLEDTQERYKALEQRMLPAAEKKGFIARLFGR